MATSVLPSGPVRFARPSSASTQLFALRYPAGHPPTQTTAGAALSSTASGDVSLRVTPSPAGTTPVRRARRWDGIVPRPPRPGTPAAKGGGPVEVLAVWDQKLACWTLHVLNAAIPLASDDPPDPPSTKPPSTLVPPSPLVLPAKAQPSALPAHLYAPSSSLARSASAPGVPSNGKATPFVTQSPKFPPKAPGLAKTVSLAPTPADRSPAFMAAVSKVAPDDVEEFDWVESPPSPAPLPSPIVPTQRPMEKRKLQPEVETQVKRAKTVSLSPPEVSNALPSHRAPSSTPSENTFTGLVLPKARPKLPPTPAAVASPLILPPARVNSVSQVPSRPLGDSTSVTSSSSSPSDSQAGGASLQNVSTTNSTLTTTSVHSVSTPAPAPSLHFPIVVAPTTTTTQVAASNTHDRLERHVYVEPKNKIENTYKWQGGSSSEDEDDEDGDSSSDDDDVEMVDGMTGQDVVKTNNNAGTIQVTPPGEQHTLGQSQEDLIAAQESAHFDQLMEDVVGASSDSDSDDDSVESPPFEPEWTLPDPPLLEDPLALAVVEALPPEEEDDDDDDDEDLDEFQRELEEEVQRAQQAKAARAAAMQRRDKKRAEAAERRAKANATAIKAEQVRLGGVVGSKISTVIAATTTTATTVVKGKAKMSGKAKSKKK